MVGGRYRLGGLLGRGACSVVFEAVDVTSGEPVALKLLEIDPGTDPDALARIRREVAALERIRSPYVARLRDVGVGADERPYIVCDLVPGRTLQAVIAAERPWRDWSAGLKWLGQAAEALDEAWKHHIIHRDLKPSNLIIDLEGNLRIVDFGLAKAIHEDENITQERASLGTPRYMSPEIALGHGADFRADIYSLGATFYHLCAGQAPFEARTPAALMLKHAQAPLPRPRLIDPLIPEDICDMITHMMAKDPASRYQSYADLLADVREARLALMAKGPSLPYGGGRAAGGEPAPPDDEDLRRITGQPSGGTLSRPTPAEIHMRGGYVGADERQARRSGRLLGFMLLTLIVLAGGMYFAYAVFGPEAGSTGSRLREVFAFLNPGANKNKQVLAEQTQQQNLSRMRDVMAALIQFEAGGGRRVGDPAQLVEAGLLRDQDLTDPWGGPYRYQVSARLLTSDGPDAVEGTADDYILDSSMSFRRIPSPYYE